MSTITIDGLDRLGDLFADIGEQLFDADFTPALRAEIPHLMETHRDHFDNQSNPVGEAWAPLAQSTIDGKGRRSGHNAAHSTILVDTGRLAESLIMGESADADRIRDVERNPGADFLVFGTSVPYSIFHDTGTRRMPARVHVGLNDTDVDKMTERLADFAVEKLKGA